MNAARRAREIHARDLRRGAVMVSRDGRSFEHVAEAVPFSEASEEGDRVFLVRVVSRPCSQDGSCPSGGAVETSILLSSARVLVVDGAGLAFEAARRRAVALGVFVGSLLVGAVVVAVALAALGAGGPP